MKPLSASTADAAPLTLGRLFMLELLAATAVLGLTIALLPGHVAPAIEKTRLSEAMLLARTGQLELVEQLAFKGVLPSAGPRALRAETQQPPKADPQSRLELMQRIEGDTLVLTGRLPEHTQRFALGFAPSEIAGEPAGSVQWLCGYQRPSAGWSGPSLGPGSTLTPAQLPFVCRHYPG